MRKLSFLYWEFQTLDVDVVIAQLIDEGNDVIALNCDQDEWRLRWTISRRVSSSDTAWVDEVFAIILSDLILVRVSTY